MRASVPSKPPRIVVYLDKKKQWRWQLRAQNGTVCADGSESYKRRASCVDAIGRAMDMMTNAVLVVKE